MKLSRAHDAMICQPAAQGFSVRRCLAAAFAIALTAVGPAWADDPLPYTVLIAGTGDSSLDTALHDASMLVGLRDPAPVDSFGLILRARDDIDRMDTVLRAFGYHRAKLAITIAGRPVDAADLAGQLTHAPSNSPTPVAIAIDPGPLFHIGQVILSGDVPADIAAKVNLVPGAPATSASVLAAKDRLRTMLRDAGHALAKVELPPARLQPDPHLIDVTFVVTAGPVVRIGAIRFAGLTGVKDEFVRRRLTLKSGERFQPAAIEAARADLASLGMFSAVRADVPKALDPDGTLPVTFVVSERPQRVFEAGMAWSTDLGADFDLAWRHRNLFGDGEQLNLTGGFQLGGTAVQQPGYQAGAQFIKPDFLLRDQALDLSVGANKSDLRSYNQDAMTEKALLTLKLSPHWSIGYGMAGEQEAITQQGLSRHYNLASVPLSAKYDDTNNILDATRGLRAALKLTPTAVTAGQGNGFLITQASASTYLDLSADGTSVIALRGMVGKTLGVGDQFDLPPDQRFYAGGGTTVRGYRYQTVGPLFADGKPTGGTAVSAFSMEYRQRFLENFGVAAFIDAGQVTTAGMPFTAGWRAGAGIGGRYYTSLGPIRVDVAVPVQRPPGGDSFELYIGIGQAF